MVDSTKAKVNLEWSPVFKINEAVQLKDLAKIIIIKSKF